MTCIDGDRRGVVLGVSKMFTVAALSLTGLRIFTRARYVQAGLGLDDLCIVVGTVCDYMPRFILE